MPNLLLFLAALVAAPTPVEAEPALRPSAPIDVASAVGDCWRAVGKGGVDIDRLAAHGWSGIMNADGKELEGPLAVYIKSSANHRIMLPRARAANSVCAVIARLSSVSEGRVTLTAIERSLRALDSNVRAAMVDKGILFSSGPHFALIDELDSDYVTKEQPGLRITVGYKIAEKK